MFNLFTATCIYSTLSRWNSHKSNNPQSDGLFESSFLCFLLFLTLHKSQFHKVGGISSGSRQNDVNACVVLQETDRSARCMTLHVFEVWTPTSTYRQFIIGMFHLSKIHTKQDIFFKYILQFYLQCYSGTSL